MSALPSPIGQIYDMSEAAADEMEMEMSEMIDRVADAINAVMVAEHDRVTELVTRTTPAPQDEVTAVADSMVSKLARAAIEAMRPEPSHPDDPDWVPERNEVITDWIDAALAPSSE